MEKDLEEHSKEKLSYIMLIRELSKLGYAIELEEQIDQDSCYYIFKLNNLIYHAQAYIRTNRTRFQLIRYHILSNNKKLVDRTDAIIYKYFSYKRK